MIRRAIAKLILPSEVEQKRQVLAADQVEMDPEQMQLCTVIDYVGGTKQQCPECSDLMSVDDHVECDNCGAQVRLWQETTVPSMYERDLNDDR